MQRENAEEDVDRGAAGEATRAGGFENYSKESNIVTWAEGFDICRKNT